MTETTMTPVRYVDLGSYLLRQGDWEGATQAFCRAIAVDPNYAPAYNNLGLILMDTNRLLEAEACFSRAVTLDSADPYAYNNLGLVLTDIGYPDKAEVCFRRALALNPGCPDFYSNLGVALEGRQRWEEAEVMYRQALERNPGFVEAVYNLATLCRALHRLTEAEKLFVRVLTLRPDYLDAELALSLLYLLRGDFQRGWERYEVLRRRKYGYRDLDIPDWQGEVLTNQSILLFWEYGYGDTLQFLRYVRCVRELGAKVTLLVQPPVLRLAQAAFPQLPVYSGEERPPGHYDVACSLLNLPLLFHTDNNNVPPPVAYGSAPEQAAAVWRDKLSRLPPPSALLVGVVWAGHPHHSNDHKRTIPFVIFRELFAVPGVQWLSLQTGKRAEDLPAAGDVLDFSQDFTDFMATAALIHQLDLVITVDTAVAHLAGTMGKPTWVLLAYDPDWRWQLEREDTPWYSSLRLFRQQSLGDWPGVISRVREALAEIPRVYLEF